MLMPNVAAPKANALADRIKIYLTNAGVSVKTFNYDFEKPGTTPDLDESDLLIVIGGDGSLLRAGHFCAPLGIPLLGIRSGRLGFLVELDVQSNQFFDRVFSCRNLGNICLLASLA